MPQTFYWITGLVAAYTLYRSVFADTRNPPSPTRSQSHQSQERLCYECPQASHHEHPRASHQERSHQECSHQERSHQERPHYEDPHYEEFEEFEDPHYEELEDSYYEDHHCGEFGSPHYEEFEDSPYDEFENSYEDHLCGEFENSPYDEFENSYEDHLCGEFGDPHYEEFEDSSCDEFENSYEDHLCGEFEGPHYEEFEDSPYDELENSYEDYLCGEFRDPHNEESEDSPYDEFEDSHYEDHHCWELEDTCLEHPHHVSHHNLPIEDPASLRTMASQEKELMEQCFQQSQEARDHTFAETLFEQSKRHKLKMEQLNAKASAIIFKKNNRDQPPSKVDLHGLYVKEAIRYAEKALKKALQRGDPELHFIVGQGNHSDDGIPRLKPVIRKAMRTRGLEVRLNRRNPGVLVVVLDD